MTSEEAEARYRRIRAWLVSAEPEADEDGALLMLWTDSPVFSARFVEETPTKALVLEGSLGHLDLNVLNQVEALVRTMVEWVTISRCSNILYKTGFVHSGIFLAPKAARVVRWADSGDIVEVPTDPYPPDPSTLEILW